MGFFTRLYLGMREKDEDDEDEDEEGGESRINYHLFVLVGITIYSSSLPMLFVLVGITIYNKSVKGLFWKFISIFSHAKPPYPLRPLHNPPTTQPLLPPTISSHPCAFDDNDDDDNDEDDEDEHILLCREENRSVQTDHHVACDSSTSEEEEEYRTHPSLSLQNPTTTSTSTITESLHLHTPSPTTLDDDRHSSPTIFDGDDRHSVCEDRVLWCQEEIYGYRTIYHHVVMSNPMHALVEENEMPFQNKEEKKKERKMKTQKYKEKGKETEEVEVEEETKEEEKKKTKKKKKKKKKKMKIEMMKEMMKEMLKEMMKEMMKEKSLIVEVEEIWIKHYSSRHRILLVGEGNFSFSACLAKAFGCASNIIATSLDSKAFLKENYKKALSNIKKLKSRGSKVVHGIDATTMANHPLLRQLKFDRIVFNFPFAGFFTYMSTESQLRRHRRLVSMFMKNSKEMIGEDGEIHISHKTNGNFYRQFKLESIASSHGLRLIEAVRFERSDYPGYNTKYGFGGDDNFNCVPSNTFKFGLKTAPL